MSIRNEDYAKLRDYFVRHEEDYLSKYSNNPAMLFPRKEATILRLIIEGEFEYVDYDESQELLELLNLVFDSEFSDLMDALNDLGIFPFCEDYSRILFDKHLQQVYEHIMNYDKVNTEE